MKKIVVCPSQFKRDAYNNPFSSSECNVIPKKVFQMVFKNIFDQMVLQCCRTLTLLTLLYSVNSFLQLLSQSLSRVAASVTIKAMIGTTMQDTITPIMNFHSEKKKEQK